MTELSPEQIADSLRLSVASTLRTLKQADLPVPRGDSFIEWQAADLLDTLEAALQREAKLRTALFMIAEEKTTFEAGIARAALSDQPTETGEDE